MKNLKFPKLIIIIVMIVFSSKINAQSVHNDVPENVAKALSTKYPDAKVKHWKTKNDLYIAAISANHHKYFAAFDKNGNWVATTSTFRWPWSLPVNVKQAFKHSGYYSWNMYLGKKVEKPSGVSYQLLIDNSNTAGVALANTNLTTDRLLEFTADGTLMANKDITANPVP